MSRDLGSLRSNSLGSVLPGGGQFKLLFVGVAAKDWPTLWSAAARHSDEVVDGSNHRGSKLCLTEAGGCAVQSTPVAVIGHLDAEYRLGAPSWKDP